MATNGPDPHVETVEDCIFCLIANGQHKEAEVITKSKELVCFADIFPAAPHHYLVVPTQHILSCHSLNEGHLNLVEGMVRMGKKVLEDRGITDMEDIRLGFHQPPFTSIDHLHLHVLAPSSQISENLHHKFIPQSYRFVTEECLLKNLRLLDQPVETLLFGG